MKASEFIKDFEMHLSVVTPAFRGIGGLALLAAEKAEAAGVVWDPEEEPLPERLELFAGQIIWHRSGIPCTAASITRETVPGQPETIAAEIVRRYNIVPEIERRLACLRKLLVSEAGPAWEEVRSIIALLGATRAS